MERADRENRLRKLVKRENRESRSRELVERAERADIESRWKEQIQRADRKSKQVDGEDFSSHINLTIREETEIGIK